MKRLLTLSAIAALATFGCGDDTETVPGPVAAAVAPPPVAAGSVAPPPVAPPPGVAQPPVAPPPGVAPPPVAQPPVAPPPAMPPVAPPAPPVADMTPTWTRVYEEIIVGTGCSGGPFCHGGPMGGLTMTDKAATYAALVGVQAMGMSLIPEQPNCLDSGLTRVVAGDAANSLLMQKLEETQTCGDRMPPSGALEASELALVRDWINMGALDN